jgi:hypothetical protein
MTIIVIDLCGFVYQCLLLVSTGATASSGGFFTYITDHGDVNLWSLSYWYWRWYIVVESVAYGFLLLPLDLCSCLFLWLSALSFLAHIHVFVGVAGCIAAI